MLNFKVKGSPWKTQQIHGTVCFKIHIKILIFYNLGQTFFWPKKQKFWLYYLQILTLFWPINFLHFQLKCGIQSISYKVLDNKPIGLFCWNETKSSLSAKSAIACFKNVWLTFSFIKRTSLMLCTAVMCFHHKPFVTFHFLSSRRICKIFLPWVLRWTQKQIHAV